MEGKIYLNDNWFFNDCFKDEMINTEYDFTKNEEVRIPHTVKETPLHYFDEHEYQKEAAYFRQVYIPVEWKGKDILLTFEGVLHSCIVYVNGNAIGGHQCGYTSFRIRLNDCVNYGRDNVIVVYANSREDQNIPPFGFVIDYMTYGGIYRDVYIEVKNRAHIEDVFVSADMDGNIRMSVSATDDAKGLALESTVLSLIKKADGSFVSGEERLFVSEEYQPEDEKNEVIFNGKYENPLCWDTVSPVLYMMKTVLKDSGGNKVDEKNVRFGFRSAEFKADGFYLNGEKFKIRGLNRHQNYAYVGYAMPKNPQRNDVKILKEELGVNAVRTSHYPQSHYFLDACDEMGLLVFTELPGWQHIGDEEWKDRAVENVKDMVLQYRNHTSIILWGVRINESVDDDEFYLRTNEAAHDLDPTRQTGGVRCYKKSNLLEDVYTYNDFIHSGDNRGCDKKSSVTSDINKGYLITEYMGHMFPTKAFDWEEHRLEDALRHARVLNDVASNEDIAGSFGWCMFDYNTHKDFGSGDRICYHGVTDMFRNPKTAAYVYAEMQDEIPVLELSSSMDIGEHPGCNRKETFIFTNADSVKMYKNDCFIKEYRHDKSRFSDLYHAPIKIDDYIGDSLEKEENMPKAKAKDIKDILNEVAQFGLYKMTKASKIKAAKMMLFHHMRMNEAIDLYNKYIGDWGTGATKYRFEAIKDGRVVKEIVKTPMTKVSLEIKADHKNLKEENSYDVSSVRIRATDENGNLLNYFNEPLILSCEGKISIIGPKVISLSGGMGGTYVKTMKESGEGRLIVKDAYGNTMGKIDYSVEL
ncbi:MAG: glycoside hydrolase family 2 protein [Lachnospiraceae bacterium]|nr:glycoside hydrolase family 2 protein [Lachnospiraceae bacterium]